MENLVLNIQFLATEAKFLYILTIKSFANIHDFNVLNYLILKSKNDFKWYK